MRGIFVHSTNRQKDYEKDSNCILNAITCWISESPTSRRVQLTKERAV